MKVFFGSCLLILLIGLPGVSAADPLMLPENLDSSSSIPTLPPDMRCNLSASNPVVDYGNMSRWQLEDVAGGGVSPGTRTFSVNIVCPYPKVMVIRLEGEGGDQGGLLRYGESGSTHIRLREAQLDNNAVELRIMTSQGISEKAEQELKKGQRLVPVINGRQVEGKVLMAQLEIQPVLAERDAYVSSPQISETIFKLILDDL